MDYGWDPAKAVANRAKHGMHLADAPAVFEDPYALSRSDPYQGESRFATIGRDSPGRVVVVIWSWNGDAKRLISRRPATARERRHSAEDADAEGV